MSNVIPKIEVQKRDRLGSRYAARLRKAGRMPLVIYGHEQQPAHVSVDQKAMTDLLHTHAHLIEVSIDGAAEPVIVKEVQWDHLGSKIVHVDLERVDLNENVTVTVELVLFGEAIGLKQPGNVLEQQLSELEIECLATRIPAQIRVDVSGLDVDQALTVADLKLPEGIQAVTDAETVVVSITHVKEEVEAPAEATATEPEVIGKKVDEAAPAEGDAKKPDAKAAKK